MDIESEPRSSWLAVTYLHKWTKRPGFIFATHLRATRYKRKNYYRYLSMIVALLIRGSVV